MSNFNDKALKGVAEAVMKIMEAEKMAKKDHDQDGKIESGKAEYLGSRIRAAKMAGKLKEEEQLEELSKATVKSYVMKKMEKPTTTNKDVKGMTNAYNRLKNYKPTSEEVEHIEEGGMPSSVIKHKQSLATKSPEELHAGFKEVANRIGKSVEDTARSTAWSHGYGKGEGKGSGHYWNKIKHLEEGVEQIDEAFPTVDDAHRRMGNYTKGTVTKTATGLKHERNYKDEDETEEKMGKKGKTYGANQKRRTNTKLYKESFTSMLKKLDEQGIKALDEVFAEEIEQIDELAKSTLGSYIKKAAKDQSSDAYDHGEEENRRYYEGGDSESDSDSADRERRMANREKGIGRAVKKITKEELETIEERSLTASESKKKEDIVMSMKKGLSGFKERYGKDAKSVMYATATKRAKED